MWLNRKKKNRKNLKTNSKHIQEQRGSVLCVSSTPVHTSTSVLFNVKYKHKSPLNQGVASCLKGDTLSLRQLATPWFQWLCGCNWDIYLWTCVSNNYRQQGAVHLNLCRWEMYSKENATDNTQLISVIWCHSVKIGSLCLPPKSCCDDDIQINTEAT